MSGQQSAHARSTGALRASAAGLVLLLGACQTLQGEPEAELSGQPARLVALIEQAARTGDPRLETAAPEMQALEAALTHEPTLSQAGVRPLEAAPSALPPGPESGDMSRVFHAVHIASYRSLDLAEAGWTIYRQNPALTGLEAVAAPVTLDSGEWYRLKAGPFDTRGVAAAVCAGLQARGEWCQVTDFNGMTLQP